MPPSGKSHRSQDTDLYKFTSRSDGELYCPDVETRFHSVQICAGPRSSERDWEIIRHGIKKLDERLPAHLLRTYCATCGKFCDNRNSATIGRSRSLRRGSE